MTAPDTLSTDALTASLQPDPVHETPAEAIRLPTALPDFETTSAVPRPLVFSAEVGPHGSRLRTNSYRTAHGTFVTQMTVESGASGAQEFATRDAMFAGMAGLYATLTERRPPMRGPAADGPNGRASA